MTRDSPDLIRRFVGGDTTATAEILQRAGTDESAELLVAAALSSEDPAPFLTRASQSATATRERQLIAIAATHIAGNTDLVDALVRDHLSDHPDNVLAAWIAAQHIHTD